MPWRDSLLRPSFYVSFKTVTLKENKTGSDRNIFQFFVSKTTGAYIYVGATYGRVCSTLQYRLCQVQEDKREELTDKVKDILKEGTVGMTIGSLVI